MTAASYDFGKPIKNGEFAYFRVLESETDPTCAEANAHWLSCRVHHRTFLNSRHNNFFHAPAMAVAEPKNS